MRLHTYLHFDGQCEAAFRFYQRCLGGEVTIMQTYGDSPMREHTPPETHGRVMHTRLAVGQQVLMGADAPPGRGERAQGFAVSIGVDDPAEADRVFHALAEGGTVQLPIQQTFWAARFGMVVDRFGIPWTINCDESASAKA